MRIEFITRWNAQGYQWNANKLEAIPSKISKIGKTNVPSHEYDFVDMPLPHDIYKEYIKILHPFWDEGVKPNDMVEVINKNNPKYSADVENKFKDAILEFANEYGATDEGYSRPFRVRSMSPTAFLLDALQLLEFINTAENGKMDPELEDIVNDHKAEIVHFQNDWWMSINSIFVCIFYSFAMREDQYKASHCRWCSAPVVHRKDAEFCQLPRQCKNKYHNELRKLKKGGSK